MAILYLFVKSYCGVSSVFLDGQEYVVYSEKYADRRGGVGK